MGRYLRPNDLDAALDALATGGRDGGPWVVVAGATDHYPGRVAHAPDEDILDVTALAGLGGVTVLAPGPGLPDGGWRIGALATWDAVAAADLPPLFDGLRAAARVVGGPQVQARATVVGNVCNASPAADGMPNLVALDAVVELASARGRRSVPVASFVTGNRRTLRATDELVTGLLVPGPLPGTAARSSFRKLGARTSLVISIAMVAAVLETGLDGRVARARVAVGSCSEVARRLPELELALAGAAADGALADLVEPRHLAGLAPIDDVRGSVAYRREAALALVRRALEDVTV